MLVIKEERYIFKLNSIYSLTILQCSRCPRYCANHKGKVWIMTCRSWAHRPHSPVKERKVMKELFLKLIIRLYGWAELWLGKRCGDDSLCKVRSVFREEMVFNLILQAWVKGIFQWKRDSWGSQGVNGAFEGLGLWEILMESSMWLECWNHGKGRGR